MLRLNYEKKDLGTSYALAVAVMVFSSFLLGLIFGVNVTGWKFWLMQALYTLFIGASAVLYAVFTKTNLFAATKMNVKPALAHVLWGCLAVVCLIACMMPINNALLTGIERLGLPRPDVDIPNDIAGLLIVACLLPCITEEMVFRGTVAQSLAQDGNKWACVAISGALFSIFHANPAQTVHQFVLGAFLTLLALRSGSLWTSVIVHFFNNALVVALSYTPLDNAAFWSFSTNTGAVVGILCAGLVGFAACVFGYIKTTKSVWQQDVQSGETEQTDVAKNVQRNASSTVLLCVAVAVCVALWVTNLFMK